MQEKTQHALQQALHSQLDQQRELRRIREQRNVNSQRILELSAQLAGIMQETELLDRAISGVCQALDLADVTFYERTPKTNTWLIRTTTKSDSELNDVVPEAMETLLNKATDEDEVVQRTPTTEGKEILSVVEAFQIGYGRYGAMVANSGALISDEVDEFVILLRTFAQSLSSLWYSSHLFAETQQRAQELEILYGRYVDNIWRTETSTLRAQYNSNGFVLERERALSEHTLDEQTIPLLISERPIGQVRLKNKSALSPENRDFAQAVIREMGNALNSAYLIQTTRANSNMLSLATEVSRAATTILDRDVLIQEVVELIRARFDYYYVGLFLVDDIRENAYLKAGTGEAGRIQLGRKHHQVIGGSSMIGTGIAENKAIVEQDVTKAEAFRFNPILPDTRSELAIPLRVRGEVIGALTVQSVETGAFSENVVSILQSMADQLAVAIENAGLFAQIQATLAETSRLYQVSRQLGEAATSKEVYEILVEFAQWSGMVDFAHILRVDSESPNYLFIAAWWSGAGVKAPQEYYPLDKFPYVEQMSQNESILVKDAIADPSLGTSGRREFYARYQIRSSAYIPIFIEGEWLGTFILHRTGDTPSFTEQEIQPFLTLADQAAVVLSNRQLFEDVQAANKRLRELDQLKTQFLANMSHELRTPLNSIIGFSKVILRGMDGPITPLQEEDLKSIHNNGQHLLGLINEILDMAKIEAGKMTLNFEMMDLETIAKVTVKDTRALVKPGVEFTWDIAPNLPEVEVDRVRMRQIFMNLLSNAAKFTEEGSIHLQIKLVDIDYVHIMVRDSGIGIDPKEHDVLFKAFEQVDSSPTRAVGGTGLGLPITKWIVTMHQGRIWFDSAVDKGTTFYIQLPVKQPEGEVTTITFDEVIQEA